jgi:hypothetical protein
MQEKSQSSMASCSFRCRGLVPLLILLPFTKDEAKPRLPTALLRSGLRSRWRGLLPLGIEAQFDQVPERATFVTSAANAELLDLPI